MSKSAFAFVSLAALALAGCGGTPETANDTAADNLALANESVGTEEPVIEDLGAGDVQSVEVAPLPTVAGTAPAAEIAPLKDAAEIERDIRAGRGIQRIRHGDGWAWMRDGRILRTAADNGSDVAYFRPGEDRPFFVQRGDRAWSYRDGQAAREYDREGNVRAPDPDRQREAQQAWRESRERRDRADNARERYGRDRPSPSPSVRPSPTPSPTARGGRDRDRDSADRPGARPRPSPSASPTARWRSPERTPRRDREPRDG